MSVSTVERHPQPLPAIVPSELTPAELKVLYARQQDEHHMSDMANGLFSANREKIEDAYQDSKAAEAVRKFYLPYTSQQNPDQLLDV